VCPTSGIKALEGSCSESVNKKVKMAVNPAENTTEEVGGMRLNEASESQSHIENDWQPGVFAAGDAESCRSVPWRPNSAGRLQEDCWLVERTEWSQGIYVC